MHRQLLKLDCNTFHYIETVLRSLQSARNDDADFLGFDDGGNHKVKISRLLVI
jgi:hypothetical protein